MRNANECRAKNPKTCYYHGAIIEMNEAMQSITTAGPDASPADWDNYFNARKKVETAEEDFQKQQWMEESKDLHGTKEPVKQRNYGRKGSPSPSGANKEGRPAPTRRPQSERQHNKSKPIVEPKVTYNDHVFPPQINYRDEKNLPAVFTRYDKTSQLPDGLMLAASRDLNKEERAQLVSFVKYQHTIATRNGKELKNIAETDVAYDHTRRSVYVKTQFEDAEQLKGFHATLTDMIANGTTPRQDGTQKHSAFQGQNAEFALYYKN